MCRTRFSPARAILVYVLLTFASNTFATTAIAVSNAEHADSALSQLSLPAVDYSAGAFISERKLPGLPEKLVSSGQFFFDKQLGFLWFTREPVMQAQFFGARKSFDYQVHNQRIRAERIRLQATRYIGRIINALIDGDWKYLERYFNAQVTPEGKAQRITLTPRNKQVAKQLTQLEFTVESHLTGYRLELANGEWQSVRFSKVTENTLNLFADCSTDDSVVEAICKHILESEAQP